MKRAVGLSLVCSFVLAACGLKVPVTIAGGELGGVVPVAPGDNALDPSIGDGSGDLGPDVILPGNDGLTPGIDPGTDPGTDPGADTGTTSSGLFKSETEGVTNQQITLCTHVPVTGAAPLARNPDRFGQFYFNYVNAELGGIHGRKVRFLAFDDAYNPTGARTAFEKCRREGAFIYLGAAGTDQIVSVAKRAEEEKVPYLHGPTSDKDLAGFKYDIHWAPTYEAQHRYLARYLVDRFGKTAVYAMVRVASVYFEAGHDAFVDELGKLGVTLAVDREVQKDENSFADVITEMRTHNVTVVNNFTTPLIWTKMIPQAGQTFRPTWTAVSPVAGYNLVAASLKANNAKATVFHHFNPACNCTDFQSDRDPSLPYASHIERFVRIFKKYSPEQSPPIDDFDYGAFVTAAGIHRLLLALGDTPTRSGLFELIKGYREPKQLAYPGCPAMARGPRRLGHSVNIFDLVGGKWKQAQGCVDVGD